MSSKFQQGYQETYGEVTTTPPDICPLMISKYKISQGTGGET
jgi:hypothetical protein